MRTTVPRPTATSSAAALAVVAAAAAILVVQATGSWGLGPGPQVLVDAAVGIGCAPMALAILTAPRPSRGTRQLAAVLMVSGTASAAAALTTALSLAAGRDTLGAQLLVQAQSWLWVPGFLPLLTLVPLLYPDGLLPGRWWRAAARASWIGIALLAAGVAVFPETFAGRVPIDKPVTSAVVASVLSVAAAALLVPAVLAAMASLVVRWRGSSGLRRRQVVVLVVAAGLLLVVTALQGTLPTPWDVVAQAMFTALLPVAIGVAVTRHGLYDLDTSVRHTLVAASLVACLAGLYLTVLALTQSVVGRDSQLGAALAAGLAGVAIQPLAKRLGAGMDRLFYGHRGDPSAVVHALGARLSEAPPDMEDVPALVCQVLVEGLRLPGASLTVDGLDRPVAVVGDDRGTATRFPLRHRGDQVGVLTVHSRPGEADLDPRDAEVVSTVAAQAAPAVAALQLRRQLQRSREQVVTAREAERRRLRHDLHDGLGATLAGLRLQIESAQHLAEGPAVDLLGRASAGVSQAVDEVRSVCEGLRPPGIDDLGLATALRLLGERLSTPELEVSVHVPESLELGPAIEAATYRIVTEALTNAAKHAGATHATVEIRPASATLEVVVHDDGRGLTPGSGLGLGSMRERAEELGGLLSITSGDGVEVRAVLPLETEEVA